MERRRRYVPNLITDMAECDANYIRLLQLFPQMKVEDCREFGIDIPGALTEQQGVAKPEAKASKTLPGRKSVVRSAATGVSSGISTPVLTPFSTKVSIKVDQRCRYTTMLMVEVANSECVPWIKWPKLEVRIYHDTKSAEVLSFERHRNLKFRYALQNANMFQADEKSQINKFFGELLSYCSEHGHSLETVSF